MKKVLFALDSGRQIVKGKSEDIEVAFTHALIEISGAEWKQLKERDPDNTDCVKVNGIAYIVGDAAITRGFQPRTVSAERYTSIYYGTLLAIALSRAFARDVNGVMLYGTHAPIDVDYRKDLIAAAKGKFTVEAFQRKQSFTVVDARGLDEPCGGMMNRILNSNGFVIPNNPLKKGSTLVLDIGGQSIDVAVMDDGKPDYSALTSEIGGTIVIEESLKKQIRTAHNLSLKGSSWLRPDRVREAIQTDQFNAGGHGVFDVKAEVEQAARPVLQTVNELVQRYGGFANYDNIILTGGGSGLLYKRLRTMFNADKMEKKLERVFFHLADTDQKTIHMANVRGAYKMLKMFERMGAVK